ncbi:MAG: hypothetical protein ABL892_04075 [Thiobacillaceae bacterium]
MKIRNSLSAALLSTCVMCMGVAPAHAAQQTLYGTTIDVTYDDTLMGLFGLPTIAGDTLFFTPTNFKTQSLNGIGYGPIVSSTLNLRITPHAGMDFSSVNLGESGDYTLSGANSFVTVTGEIRAFDVANPSPLSSHLTNNIIATAPLNIIDGLNHDWNATAALNLASFASVQTINLTLENILNAYTDSSDIGPKLAFIEKKFVGVSLSIVTTPVPEAHNWAMMMTGLGLVGFQLRRRQNRIG